MKIFVMNLCVGFLLLLPFVSGAQIQDQGDLRQELPTTTGKESLGEGDEGLGNTLNNLPNIPTIADPGRPDAPIDGGVVLLVVAGVGYGVSKRKRY